MKILYLFLRKIDSLFTKIRIHFQKKLFKKAGKNIYIGKRSWFTYENIEIGNNVSIGLDSGFNSTRAKIVINDHVIFGPHCYVVTGNHNYRIKGRFLDSITDSEKEEADDQDVIFEGDNWIGTGSIILKGVTVGKGSIIGAGSVVTKSTIPYGIYGGNPAKFIKMRFED